jgi:hypothetical protein
VTESDDLTAADGRPGAIDPSLNPLVERLRTLRSAWGVLAPSGLSSEKSDIAETGRALNEDVIRLASAASGSETGAAVQVLSARLDNFEDEIRSVAFKIPVAQLRSTLPDQLSADRRGVLDLLDLMIGAELRGLEGTGERIPSIDYVITLLCTAGGEQALHDPVQLTARLHELSQRSTVEYDPRLPDIEAEFFHAADMYVADARGELQLRALRNRKVELGASFFAPQVLRAIVTYNAALLRQIDEEVEASQDWGSLPPTAPPADFESDVPVFESTVLMEISHAVQRRLAGGAPELVPVDRIAWCLDLDFLDPNERRALTSDTPLRQNLTGAVVLIGLLCRSSVVLEEEFPAAGIPSALIFDVWVPELAELIQDKVNHGIAGDDYREACLLSELKSKFLYTSMADVHRKNRGHSAPKAPESEPAQPRTDETAKQIARQALREFDAERLADEPGNGPAWRGWKSWPWKRIGAVAAAVCGAAFVFAIGGPLLLESDHDRFDRDALDRVSPYLSKGTRNGSGSGTGFVGRIRDGWAALDVADRQLVATDLVEALREQGVRDVMIYDDEGQLRIQALGIRPAQVVPDRAAAEGN